jgi:non-heme chloroperoxidase
MTCDSGRWLGRLIAGLVLALGLAFIVRSAAAQDMSRAQSRFFVSSDGVRLHYLEAGPARSHTIVLVPGWTMPAWIWGPQIAALSRSYHVIAFDPRGQGDSEVAPTGYEPGRRGQDIAELIAVVSSRPVLLVGWSLGVLDTLAYIHAHGDARIAGLVLVDNSVGEEPAPLPARIRPRRGPRPPHEEYMREFVRSMFRKPQSESYLEMLTDATLRTPEYACTALLSYPVPRSYWREAVYATAKPLLYAVRPAFGGQALNLQRYRPGTEIAIFPDAGHALFVDDAFRFNALVQDFVQRRIWP